jgi:AAA+ superfamily predicted ATPase
MISVSELPLQERFKDDADVFKVRMSTAWQHYLARTDQPIRTLYISADEPNRRMTAAEPKEQPRRDGRPTDISVEQRAQQYHAQSPRFGFERLIVPDETRNSLLIAGQILALEKQVFDDWGIRSIEPFPRSALNFHGVPGTGKTLAAHALASHLGCKILLASYAQIETMYHGEGPKNIEAVFYAAERDRAVLFLDEADSLLSKRLTNVTQGSEQAINSMRSQLLLCMEQFRGVVVFATNLVTNYDPAFETRVRSIEFLLPDFECRKRIWAEHFPSQLPLSHDVSIEEMATIEGLCGREIRNAVVDAALQAASHKKSAVAQQDLLDAVSRVIKSRISREENSTVHELTGDEQAAVEAAVFAIDSK